MKILLLTIFICSYFLHLSERLPFLGVLRFELLLGVFILISAFMSQYEDKWRLSVSTAVKLNSFLLYIFLSLPFVTWPGSVIQNNLIFWVKVALFFVFIVSIVRTEKQLKLIILVFLGCQTIRILEPLYLHITTGYWGDIAYSHVGGFKGLDRLKGGPFDVVNATQFGWVIVNTVPFFYYLFWQSKLFNKIIFSLIMPAFFYTLMLSGSRSGMLSLIITFIGIILLSKQRVKNLVVVSVIFLPIAVYIFFNVSSDIQTRYMSLIDSNVAGADTAKDRSSGLMKQITSISNNPLFGNGLGTSYETNSNVFGGHQQLTHNLYIETLQETGIIGFTFFMLFITSIVSGLKEAKKILEQKGKGEDDWLFRLVSAIQVWVLMDLFYSMSCFGLSSWEWYFFGGVATVSLALARQAPDENNLSHAEIY